MLYAPNTTHWGIGDIVIHDADAKEGYMLMRVIGYTKEGLVKTRYVYGEWFGKSKRKPETYLNDLKYLHDPKRWEIEPPTPITGGVVR